MNDIEKMIKAFPTFLAEDVTSLLGKISLRKEYPNSASAISETFAITVDKEILKIPYRIYFE